MSELRGFLKAARESIEKKDYKEALKQCRGALKIDKKNYNAWLMVGKSSFESFISGGGKEEKDEEKMSPLEQADTAYRKAIEIDEANPFAWKGLMEVHNRSGDHVRLEPALVRMIQLTPEVRKSMEYRTKLAETLKKLGRHAEAIQTWREIIEIIKVEEDIAITVESALVQIAKILEENEAEAVEKEVDKRHAKVIKANLKSSKNVGKTEVQLVAEEAATRKEIQDTIHDERLSNRELDEIYAELTTLTDASPSVWIYGDKYIARMIARRRLSNGSNELKKAITAKCQGLLKRQYNSPFLYETLLTIQQEDGEGEREEKKLYPKLLHISPTNTMAQLWLGMALSDIYFQKYGDTPIDNQVQTQSELLKFNLNEEARNMISKGLKSYPTIIDGWTELAKLQLVNSLFQAVMESVKKGNSFIEKATRDTGGASFHRCSTSLHLVLGHTYHKWKKYEDAIQTYKKILEHFDSKCVPALKGLSSVTYDLKDYSSSLQWVQQIHTISPEDTEAILQHGKVLFVTGEIERAVEQLKSVLEKTKGEKTRVVADAHYWLGRSYYSLGGEYVRDKNLCHKHLLLSAQLNPNFSGNFSYLGHFYRDGGDVDKAKRCYQKAFSLNPLDTEAGISLADLYIENKQTSLAVNLYRTITSKSARVKWAWLRLAIYQLTQAEHDDAVVSFQAALREDSQDAISWQGLAETYRRQGKVVAALKAFTRAVEINPSLDYSQYQVASLQKLLGQSHESLNQFKNALQVHPNYLPALKGLGEAHLNNAIEAIQKGLYKNDHQAQENLDEAVKTLEYAVKFRKDIACLWKLLADSYTCYHRVPIITDRYTLSTKDGKELSVGYKRDLLEKLKKGEKAYEEAYQLNPSIVSVLYDLSINLYFQCKNSDDVEEMKSGMKRSRETMHRAIQASPNEHTFWNALGVIEETPQLQQNAFIRSIQLETRNPMAWNNLGALYLQHGKLAEAYRAYESALSVSSIQPAAWMGQGITTEFVGSRDALKKSSKLLKQAIALGTSGLAHQVHVSLGTVSMAMNEYSSASTALNMYTIREPFDSQGHLMLSLSLEGQGLFHQAEEHMRIARQLVRSEPSEPSAEIEPPSGVTLVDFRQSVPKEMKERHVSVNMARIRSAMRAKREDNELEGYLDEMCERYPEEAQLGMYTALLHNERGAPAKAVQVLEKLNQSNGTSDEDKKQALICLAIVSHKDGKDDKAKNYIAQWELKVYSVKKYPQDERSQQTLIALALLIKEFKIARTYLDKMYKTDPRIEAIYLLDLRYYLLQGMVEEGKRVLSKVIHLYPSHPSLWNRLNRMILDYNLGSSLLFNVSRNLLTPLVQSHESSKKKKKEEMQRNIHRYGSLHYSALLSRHNPTVIQSNEVTEATLRFGKVCGSFSYSSIDALRNVSSSLHRALHIDPSSLRSWYLLCLVKYSIAILSQNDSTWNVFDSTTRLVLSQYDHRKGLSKEEELFLRISLSDVTLHRSVQSVRSIDESVSELDKIPSELTSQEAHNSLSHLLHRQRARLCMARASLQKDKEEINRDAEKAITSYKTSLRHDLNNELSWQELAAAYEFIGCNNSSEQVLNKACDYFEPLPEKMKSAFTTLVRLSHHYVKSRKWPQVSSTIDRALALFPQSPVALLIKGLSLLKGNDLHNAEQCLQDAIYSDLKLPLSNLLLSRVHTQMNEDALAADDLFYELDNNKSSDAVLYHLGLVLKKQGKEGEAKSYFQRAFHMNPLQGVYLSGLSQLNVQTGNKGKK
ncbi:tetratricopeptide repeat protein 37-like [Planoprotostelium fungivorum]|uniref:Tetratricopeptide repeat protein 37-like n=1 Tax=Planoprotostelium fungivorum TaxID=1890364 RepID=A0A2P6NI20_9EUKA|nr:tetratricopeptide repeat protein 37-like [Planoprotostelium fungivorum]